MKQILKEDLIKRNSFSNEFAHNDVAYSSAYTYKINFIGVYTITYYYLLQLFQPINGSLNLSNTNFN